MGREGKQKRMHLYSKRGNDQKTTVIKKRVYRGETFGLISVSFLIHTENKKQLHGVYVGIAIGSMSICQIAFVIA